jgi:hypothetical protein
VRARRLICAGVGALALPMLATTASTATAAEATATCTPTITMGKPYQDVGGFVVFTASYTVCGTSRVTLKYRDRDNPTIAGSGSTGTSEPSGTTFAGTCYPDGQPHRWAAYATIKNGPTLLVKSATVYLKAKAVKGNCAPWSP